jgi:iron complex outermembrane receptor protein
MWLASLSFAQSSPPVDPFQEPDESELYRFDEELVTVASRYAQTARKAPSIVSVVSADEIRDRGYRTLSDVLRDLPGFYVWKSPEGRDLAAIRGIVSADDNKLLVLVDGMPWYEGVYTHGFIDDYLPISNIRQVEVIKGPGSAIYGTNAFTGVVNVVTFDGPDLEGGRARIVAGSTGRADLTATGGGRIGNTRATASAYARVFSQTGTGLDRPPDRGYDLPGTDPRKAVNVGAHFVDGGLDVKIHHVDYQHVYLFGDVEDPYGALNKTLDNFSLQYHDTFGDLRYHLRPGTSQISPYVFYHRYDNPGTYFYGGDITIDADTLEASQVFTTVDAEKLTEREGAGVDLEVEPGVDHKVVGGVGIESVRVLRLYDEAFDSDGADPYVANGFGVVDDCGGIAGLPTNPRPCVPPRLRNLFGYGQYTWTAAPFLELTAGLRIDKRLPTNAGEQPTDGAFVTSISPRLGVLLVPTDRVTAKVLYGRAFRAPNVRELLVRAEPDPDTGAYPFATGNLDLNPETVHTGEAEIVADVTDGLEIRGDGNASLLANEIDKVAPGIYCNLPGDLVVVGGEAGVKGTAGPVTASADWSMSLAQYSAGPRQSGPCDVSYAGRTQYEFPPQMVQASLRVAATDQLSATVFGEAYSTRPRKAWAPDVNRPDGAPFALLHASARATGLGPAQRFEVGATVRNVLNTRFDTGIYRDDADNPDLPGAVEGEGRVVLVSVEAKL